MKLKTWLIILTVAGGLFLIKWLFIPSTTPPAANAPSKGAPVPAAYTVVEPVSFREELQSTGTLLANEEVVVKAETSGRIITLLFREGAPVSKGDLMVRINDADLQAQLKKVRSALRLAESRVDRNRKLMEMQGISREEFDALVNEVDALRADEEVILSQLAKMEIRAPFSGVAGLRKVSEGALVNSQQEITTLQQLQPLKLEFSVPENYQGRIHKGDTVYFTVSGSAQKHSATVYAINPAVSTTTRSLQIRAVSPNKNGDLLPGSFARVNLSLSNREALMVPTESIVPVLKGQQVFVMRSGKADTVSITTGVRNDTAIQVLSGLQAGDTVLCSGLMQVKPGGEVLLRTRK